MSRATFPSPQQYGEAEATLAQALGPGSDPEAGTDPPGPPDGSGAAGNGAGPHDGGEGVNGEGWHKSGGGGGVDGADVDGQDGGPGPADRRAASVFPVGAGIHYLTII